MIIHLRRCSQKRTNFRQSLRFFRVRDSRFLPVVEAIEHVKLRFGNLLHNARPAVKGERQAAVGATGVDGSARVALLVAGEHRQIDAIARDEYPVGVEQVIRAQQKLLMPLAERQDPVELQGALAGQRRPAMYVVNPEQLQSRLDRVHGPRRSGCDQHVTVDARLPPLMREVLDSVESALSSRLAKDPDTMPSLRKASSKFDTHGFRSTQTAFLQRVRRPVLPGRAGVEHDVETSWLRLGLWRRLVADRKVAG